MTNGSNAYLGHDFGWRGAGWVWRDEVEGWLSIGPRHLEVCWVVLRAVVDQETEIVTHWSYPPDFNSRINSDIPQNDTKIRHRKFAPLARKFGRPTLRLPGMQPASNRKADEEVKWSQ
jgi:hypothetical protein